MKRVKKLQYVRNVCNYLSRKSMLTSTVDSYSSIIEALAKFGSELWRYHMKG